MTNNRLPILNPALLRKPTTAPLSSPASSSDDITRRKHGGSQTSERANQIAAPHRAFNIQRILEIAERVGENGVTLYEAAAELDLLINTVSGLLSRLKKQGELTPKKVWRNGSKTIDTRPSPSGAPCAVLILKKHAKEQ